MQKACFLTRLWVLCFFFFMLVHFALWIYCLLLEETEPLISLSLKTSRRFRMKCYLTITFVVKQEPAFKRWHWWIPVLTKDFLHFKQFIFL